MLTGPSSPTKPIPPTVPAVSPVTMTSKTSSPNTGTLTAGDKSNPELSDGGTTAEGQAKQGTSVQVSSAEKSPSDSQAATNQLPPAGASNTQQGTASSTTVPFNKVPDNKTVPYHGYVWFIGVVIVVAILLTALRLFKRIKKRSHTATENSFKTKTSKEELGIDMAISPQSNTKKAQNKIDFQV